MNKKKTSLWERYLTKEIGIEFKACLYFFAILFIYCVYKLTQGSFTADILHMAEMILLCYIICYVQVYLLGNFDESESFGAKEAGGIFICTAVYTGFSLLFDWFERSVAWTAGFAAYIILVYICIFLIYKVKRRIDDKVLNEELEMFQSRPGKEEDTEAEP